VKKDCRIRVRLYANGVCLPISECEIAAGYTMESVVQGYEDETETNLAGMPHREFWLVAHADIPIDVPIAEVIVPTEIMDSAVSASASAAA